MRKGSTKSAAKLAMYSSAVVMAAMSVPMARAAVTVDGLLDADYGTPRATQTVNTSFGDNTNVDGNTANGSELDAAYGVVQSGTGMLNLFFAGNVETNFNHLNIFIADGRSGQSTLNAAGGGSNLNNMNGSKFAQGFTATYALDINGGGQGVNPPTWFANSYDLRQAVAPATFLGSYTPPSTTAQHDTGQFGTSGVFFGVDNSNTAGVIGDGTGSAADPNAANAVATGLEISIPLSLLGNPHGSLKVLADINGGGNGFLANQFLPGLPVNSGSVGGSNGKSSFDFSASNTEFFSVGIPAGNNTNGNWLPGGGGSWSTAANWSTNPSAPNFAGDSATFGSATTASTVTLDGNKTVGQISFNSASSYTIAAGASGTLSIDDTGDSGGFDPSIDVSLGNHTISAPLSLAATTAFGVTDNTSLTVSGNISGAGGISKAGAGSVILSGSNSFGGGITVLAGTVELDSASAASDTPINLGDPSTDLVPATLAIGVSGLTIGNHITTNHDLSATNTFRTISGTYTSGNATVSSTIDVNGGINFFLPNAGTSLTVTGLIEAGTDTHSSARHSIHVSGLGTVILT
ncbi:MAG TPA: autotransporter-associated beta strand repeat-containing protein, partial [Tepidisphaeraceae bacterium]|nr:autotransporter-associated beta strand repeat-containing protein [Tepidisphaeraceae bacterium]